MYCNPSTEVDIPSFSHRDLNESSLDKAGIAIKDEDCDFRHYKRASIS